MAIAIASFAGGCSKTYSEIEVRDPGRVAVGLWDARGVTPALPADGSQRVVPLPVPGVIAGRRGREIVLGWEGLPPVMLVDERGILPRTGANTGLEVRERTLWAAYNVTPNRVLPQQSPTEESIPVALSTDMSNVVDARQVREVRHWPGYVCTSLGAVLMVVGTGLLTGMLTSSESDAKVAGGVYVAGAVPLLVYGIINLTSSNEVRPLEIPGAPR